MVDQLFSDHVVGWDLEESDAARAEIHRPLFADTNAYVHAWQGGDLTIWDNVVIEHGRMPVPEDGPRTPASRHRPPSVRVRAFGSGGARHRSRTRQVIG
jgi:alpha-ketoglutarate-dependent taurine dioxygenase